MKNHTGNKFVLIKESIESWNKENFPRFRMDGKQVKIVGDKHERIFKRTDLVDTDKKAIYLTPEVALQDCIPKHIQNIVKCAIRNIREEKEYSNVPEVKKPEKTAPMRRGLTD